MLADDCATVITCKASFAHLNVLAGLLKLSLKQLRCEMREGAPPRRGDMDMRQTLRVRLVRWLPRKERACDGLWKKTFGSGANNEIKF